MKIQIKMFKTSYYFILGVLIMFIKKKNKSKCKIKWVNSNLKSQIKAIL